MKLSISRILAPSLLLLAGLPSSAQISATLGAYTPTNLTITLKRVDLQHRDAGPFDTALFSTPHSVNVIGSGKTIGGLFTASDIRPDKFTGIRLTLDGSGQYSGVDPCHPTAPPVTDADVRLATNNGSDDVLIYEEPHPVLGLAPGAFSMEPFQVPSSSNVNLHLVFPVDNSVVCLSDEAPLYNVSGNQTNLNQPLAVAFDSDNGDYIVTNPPSNQLTFHARSDLAAAPDTNVPPRFTLTGADTQLNIPTGIAVNNVDALDPTKQEIAVANAGADDVTVYHRSDFAAHPDGNVPPAGVLGGDQTLLNSPGGLYIDHTRNQLVVANGGSNSIAFYNLDANGMLPVGNVAPQFLLSGGTTALNTPCGVQVRESTGDVYVSNNRTGSIAVYHRADFASSMDTSTPPQVILAPAQLIAGPHTELIAPCGLALDNRQDPPPIAAVSSVINRVLIFDPLADGDAYPARTLRGPATLMSGPMGLAIDSQDAEMIVGNKSNNSLEIFSINDGDFTAHLHDPPTMSNESNQQTIYVRYTFVGSIDNAGNPIDSAGNLIDTANPALQTQYAGYSFAWKIVDDKLRQSGDANSARLIPPENVVWGLADGSFVSSLALSCPSFTPFTTLQLFTNCTQPLIATPFPAAEGDYRLIAALLGAPNIKRFTLHQAPLSGNQIPRLHLSVAVGADTDIVGMDWRYEDGNGAELSGEFPLIKTQSVSILSTRPYSDVDPCYRQTAGNSPNLIYTSPTMGRDARTLTDVKNNSCQILLKDVDTITLTAVDALGTSYSYSIKEKGVTP